MKIEFEIGDELIQDILESYDFSEENIHSLMKNPKFHTLLSQESKDSWYGIIDNALNEIDQQFFKQVKALI